MMILGMANRELKHCITPFGLFKQIYFGIHLQVSWKKDCILQTVLISVQKAYKGLALTAFNFLA